MCFIWFLDNKPRYQKLVKIRDTQFCNEDLKTKRSKVKIFFWPSGAGIRTLDFPKSPPTIWINGGDKIKSRQGSQNFSTLENTVKLGFKERLSKEQLGNSKQFPVTNIPVHILNSKQIGISEQLYNDQTVPYYQVQL